MHASNGMELRNISKDDPAEVLLFIAVNHHGNMFAFVNALGSQMDFHPDWNVVRPLLKPYPCHRVRARGWNTTSATGQTFEIMDHICEFGSIHQARAANKMYLRTWMRWVEEDSTAEDVRANSTAFVKGLRALGDLNALALKSFEAQIPVDDAYAWALNFVADTLEAPDTPVEIDNTLSEPEWLTAFIKWTEQETQ